MAEEGYKRKLAAILSADVEGYSRLMGADEEATIHTITEYREIIAEQVKRHAGRVVDSPGDNVLAEFDSVVDALKCAVQTQEEITERNEELPENRKMEFRIGINLGDVAEEGDRIYGDGVNVAARIESLADPGGICISRTAYDQVRKKLELGYEYLGEHSVKNIDEPVRVYRVLTTPEHAGMVIGEKTAAGKKWRRLAYAAIACLIVVAGGLTAWNIYLRQTSRVDPADIDKMAFPLPDKPSIAVLPFDNMSGDPEQEHIADGVTENIITALSQISEMFVIARNSTFTYKGKPVKVQQVSEELGVRYVLEGSIQKAGDRVRITAQLVDTINGHHLWAEKYDRDFKDLFDLLDDITKKIVVELQVKLTHSEGMRISERGTDSLEAWLLCIKGMSHYWRLIENDNIKARELFEQAVKIDPNFVSAWASLAGTHATDVDAGWSKSPVKSFKQLVKCAQRAISLDDSSPLAHHLMSVIYFRQGQHQKAIEEGEKAVSLAPSNAFFHAVLGSKMRLSGRPEEAIMLIKKAMRLSPYYPANYLMFLGRAYHQTGNYEDAFEAFQQLLERSQKGEADPKRAHVGLVLCYLEFGQVDKALNHASEVFKINPNYSFFHHAKRNLLYTDMERFKNLISPVTSLQAKPVGKERFVYEGTPSFSFEYPQGSKNLKKSNPSMVLRMRSPGGPIFSAGVDNIPMELPLSEIGLKHYAMLLNDLGSNIEVISNKEITLKDGTKVYRTEIKWLYLDGTIWLNTLLISAYKDGKWAYLVVHASVNPEAVAWIVESLRFD